MEYVEVKTSEKVLLHGFYSGKNNNECIIYIHGLGADFESSVLPKSILKKCTNNSIDFLYANTQGSSLMREIMTSEGTTINGGAAYENYNNWYQDLDAWFKFLKKYQKIIVVSHSLGCNKIIDYMHKTQNNKVSKIFLLAPQDTNYLVNIRKHNGMLQEALENKKNGNNNLISQMFLGFCYLSTNTFLDFYENKKINNIPYMSTKDYSIINSIKTPIKIYIGSNDKKIELDNYFDKLIKECKNIDYKIIKDANHNFKSKENILANLIINEIKKELV